MEHAMAIRAVQDRFRQERAEKRALEAELAEAAEVERGREARKAREEAERRRLWEHVVSAAEECYEEDALATLPKVRDVERLLAEVVGTGGATLMHMAVARDLQDLVQVLLQLDPATVRLRDAEGQTPLHRAAATDGSGEVTALLANHCRLADMDRRDAQGRTPVDIAREWGLGEAAKVLVDARERLAAEAEAARRRKAEEALAAEASAPVQVEEVDTFKARFPSFGHMAGITALREGRYADAMALIGETTWVFVNVKDDNKRSLLHLAAARGRDEVCQALLRRSDFTVADDFDKDVATALHVAAAADKPSCCQAMVASPRFTAVNALDLRRRTALHLAAMRGHAECYYAIAAHPDCCPLLPDCEGRSAPEYAVQRGIEAEPPDTAVDTLDL